jgi:hypothetical protein
MKSLKEFASTNPSKGVIVKRIPVSADLTHL